MNEVLFENIISYLNKIPVSNAEFDKFCNKNLEKIKNLRDKKGNTLLHLVIKYKNVELTKILIKYGINLDEKNFLGETALYNAVNNLDKNNINLLLEHKCNPLIKNCEELTVIDLLKNKEEKEISQFKSSVYKDNNTAFCHEQILLEIENVKEQIFIYSNKYWYDIELKEINLSTPERNKTTNINKEDYQTTIL